MSTSIRSAAVGLVVTLGVFGAVFLIACLLAPVFADTVIESREYGTPRAMEADRPWVVSQMRSQVYAAINVLWPIFCVHWLLASLLGKGRVARAKVANWTFIFGSVTFFLVLANGYFSWAETFCDQLPYPHEGFQLMRIHECPSSGIFFAFAGWAGLVLLLVSLIIRILESRRSVR